MNLFTATSSLVIVLVALGLYFRANKAIHIPLMISAFIIDLSMVLVIELQRHAIENVVQQTLTSPSPFVIFHVIVSLAVFVFYIMQAVSGMKFIKFGQSLMQHRQFAISFVVLRIVNYITSFSMTENLVLG